MSPYAKFYVAIVVAVLIAGLTAAGAAVSDNIVTASEWVQIALVSVVAFGGAAGVYQVKNAPLPGKKG